MGHYAMGFEMIGAKAHFLERLLGRALRQPFGSERVSAQPYRPVYRLRSSREFDSLLY